MTEAPHVTHHPGELGFWRKYVFSVDHKVIGIQYALTGLTFLFLWGLESPLILECTPRMPPRHAPSAL